MLSRNRKKGFTLIELLVVISIIALLLSVMSPALSKARERVRKVICSSNLRSCGMLLQTYAASYKQHLPYAHNGWGTPDNPKNWAEIIFQWNNSTSSQKIVWGEKTYWSCPSANPKVENAAAAGTLGANITLGMNDGFINITDPKQMPGNSDWALWNGRELWNKPIPMFRIRKPAATVLMADVRAAWTIYTWRWYGQATRNGSYILRHDAGSNFLFVDGHIEYSKPEANQVKYNINRPDRFKYSYENY